MLGCWGVRDNGRVIEGELGSFLRTRREAVRPEDVGLPRGERRRTPGLRRAEVATLAGISVEYLTRLEQGRDRHPSTQVVAAVADALRLDVDDRRHLHDLVAISQGTELVCRAGCPEEIDVPPGLVALLDRLEPTPAAVVGRRAELLAWTETFERLARPLGMLDGEPPDLLRYVFTDDRARDALGDWSAFADTQVAWLHQHGNGPDVGGLVDELTDAAGSEFADRWARRPTGRSPYGPWEVRQPEVGPVRLDPQVLAADDALWVVAHLPADGAAEAAIDRLAGRRPGALRQVAP